MSILIHLANPFRYIIYKQYPPSTRTNVPSSYIRIGEDMVSARKRKGLEGKLTMPFNRAPKPSMQFGSKVKPTAPPADSLGLLVDDEFVLPPSKLKASSTLAKKEGGGDFVGHFEVDKRAASYISYVQERFRLEQGIDDRRNHQQVARRKVEVDCGNVNPSTVCGLP